MAVASASELKDPTTRQVVLYLGLAVVLAATVIFLALSGLDPAVILSGIASAVITVGGGLAWSKAREVTNSLTAVSHNVDSVKEISNGRTTELLEDNKRLHEQIAALSLMVNPPKDPE